MTAAAFQATYADFKLIKTRGVVSISFELPVEQAQAALDVLGGMPVAATEVWCGIARLVDGKEVVRNDDGGTTQVLHRASAGDAAGPDRPRPVTSPRQEPSTPGGAKQAFRDMRLPNQAGMLCDTEAFNRFIAERLKWEGVWPADKAADYVRRYCNVASRKDIRPRTVSGDRWVKLVEEYRTWMHAPEMA